MASLKGMTEEEKRLRKRKQLNEAQKRYYQKHKEYYKDFYKNKYEDLKEKIAKAVEYIKTKGLKEEEWQNGFCVKATATYTREEIFDLLNILQEGGE